MGKAYPVKMSQICLFPTQPPPDQDLLSFLIYTRTTFTAIAEEGSYVMFLLYLGMCKQFAGISLLAHPAV